MKLTIDIKTLLAAINRAKPVASGRLSIPILSCFLLTANKKALTVAASDCDMYISMDAECKVWDEGSVCIFARKLSDVLSVMGAGEVELETDSKHFVTIRRGADLVKLVGLPATEFPKSAESEWTGRASVPQRTLKAAIERTLPFVSTEESRATLNGVCLTSDEGKMVMVSTNGSYFMRSAPVGVEFDGCAIIPTAAASLIAKLCEDDETVISIELSDNLISVTGNGDRWRVVSKLIEGAFPNWKQIIPSEQERGVRASGNRESLLGAVGLASLTSNHLQAIPTVKLSLGKKRCTVASETSGIGNSDVEIPGMACTEDFTICFDPIRFRSVVESFDGEGVTLQFTDPSRSATIQDDTGTAILNPCRIK